MSLCPPAPQDPPAPTAAPDIELPAGAQLPASLQRRAQAWRLIAGALRVARDDGGARDPLVQLALAGDLVGLEPLCGQPRLHTLQALTDCRLQPLQAEDGGERGLLAEALTQQWKRSADMAALRRGPMPECIKRLLLMLAGAHHGRDPGEHLHGLPKVRDIAEIVDSTPETVSRVITALRRMALLADRQAGQARYDARRLAACAMPVGMSRSDLAAGLA